MKDNRFTFSVIIPVFDVEPYLAEAIESVLSQTIGFEENIELILVNDGSTDDSESICLHYHSTYPDNITYVRQDHAGVSVARNNGMSRARGRYVNFLDGDDRWSPDAFQVAQRFMETHPDVDVVAARMHLFDAVDAPHPLDYKFDVDRVVDIVAEPANPQLSGVSTFIRREALVGHFYDPRLKVSQDFRFIAPIILDAGRYGLLGSATYWYRKRSDFSSSINRSKRLRTWYFDTPRYCYQEIFEVARNDAGEVMQYAQHCVMYDLQWRLLANVSAELTGHEKVAYRQLLIGLLEDIGDDVIIQQRQLPVAHKLFALALKHGMTSEEIRREFTIDDQAVSWRGMGVSDLNDVNLVIERIEARGGELHIEGFVDSVFAGRDVRVSFHGRDWRVAASHRARPDLAIRSLGEVVSRPAGFSAAIPLGDRLDVRTRLSLKRTPTGVQPVFGPDTGLTSMETSYRRDAECTYYLSDRRIVARRNPGPVWHFKRELRYLAELCTQKRGLILVAERLVRGRK